MAREPSAPWSRWDAPGVHYIPKPAIQPIGNRQFDAPSYTLSQTLGGSSSLADATLIDQKPSDDDPSFLDCIYSLPNGAQQIVQQCYVELGCCDGGCCDNTSWKAKYGIAVALICIFCAIVVIAFVVWLLIWLLNRSRDKAQRRNYESQMPTPSPSPVYAPTPINAQY